MVRVGEIETNRRGSPSEVFSRDINEIHKNRKKGKTCSRSVTILLGFLLLLFILATIALAIVVGIKVNEDQQQGTTEAHQSDDSSEPKFNWPEPSGSLSAHYRKASVTSDHGLCSEIGRDILIEGGNAVDSMIATLLCIGTVNPQSSGIGGGFLMTLYNASTGQCQTVNARETAPAAATEDMFVENPRESITGYKSIATPSEVHGFWTVFTRFGSGKVTWKRLFEPSILLAKNGFPVSSNLAQILATKEKDIQADETMKSFFVNAETKHVYEEGDIMKRTRLGRTYESLANATNPVDLFYRRGIAQTIAGEITDHGGLVNETDLENYETVIDDSPLIVNFGNDEDIEMCGPPPPSSFVITQSIVQTMSEFYKDSKVDLDDPLVYHRLIEAEKFAYAQRTKLGDTNFVPSAKELVEQMLTEDYIKEIVSKMPEKAQNLEYYGGDMTTQDCSVKCDLSNLIRWPRMITDLAPDHGTSHVSIIDKEGNAVSCTSTVNQYFGAMRGSATLGIIWNDQMDDFSTPGQKNGFGYAPSETNFIVPGKRPMSSMSPSIVYDKAEKKVKMVVGASGGSYIISSTAQTIIRSLLFNQTVKAAVDAPRFHNQYLPEATETEKLMPKTLIDILVNQYGQNFTIVDKQKSVVQALLEDDGFIEGNSDFRRKTATYPTGF